MPGGYFQRWLAGIYVVYTAPPGVRRRLKAPRWRIDYGFAIFACWMYMSIAANEQHIVTSDRQRD